MRVFSIVVLLLSLLLVGWIASKSLLALSGSPVGGGALPSSQNGGADLIQQAESIRSADRERQLQHEKLVNE